MTIETEGEAGPWKRSSGQLGKRVQALTAAQAQERERISRLEVQVGESVRATDRYGATKADVTAVLVEVEKVRSDVEKVRSDIRVLRIWLFVGMLALAFLDNIPWVDVLRLLLRFGG